MPNPDEILKKSQQGTGPCTYTTQGSPKQNIPPAKKPKEDYHHPVLNILFDE